MDAILFYVDDWLSSSRVLDMDADEERGYFRLLLHSAKNPDCGLPFIEQILANRSLLRSQWNKETKNEEFRFGKTSGEKILECFFVVRNGRTFNAQDNSVIELDPKSEIDVSLLQECRIYNERLLKVFFEFKRRQKRATDAANKRWHGNDAPANPPPDPKPDAKGDATAYANALLESSPDHATRVENENSSSLEGGAGGNRSGYPPGSEGWDAACEAAAEACMYFDPSPQSTTCTQFWCPLSMAEKRLRIRAIRERIECGQYGCNADPQYIPTFDSFLRNCKHLAPCRPRPDPKAKGKRSNPAIDYLEEMAFGGKGEHAA